MNQVGEIGREPKTPGGTASIRVNDQLFYCIVMPEPTPAHIDENTVRAWCSAAAAGDASALESLLATVHTRLLAFIRRKVGVDWQGKIDAEDVLQEAYVDLHDRTLDFQYTGPDSFYYYAARIAEHRFIDLVRRLRRKKRDVARESTPVGGEASRHASLLANVLRDSITPSRVMRRDEAVRSLMCAVARLPDDYRQVVLRHHLGNEPIKTIAAEMGRTEDAVRRLAGRALERLKEWMTEAPPSNESV